VSDDLRRWLFYMLGLNGTIATVALMHAVHGLVIAVWMAAAAFAAVDIELELAARNMGALRTALTVTLPLARVMLGDAGHRRQYSHHPRRVKEGGSQ
jgi:ABC-type spermidine/putrescine transport system permease subunit II